MQGVGKGYINANEEKFFQVGVQLPLQEKELLAFLRENVDVFAWSAYEAPEVDLDFICHHLNQSKCCSKEATTSALI